jgi:protocatechuate 3,4-dioxygenase beta subunit
MLRSLVILVVGAAAALGGQAGVTGRIVADATGEPIPNARVRISGAGRTQLAITDADGRFSFSAPQSGAFTIFAVRSAYVAREQTLAAATDPIVLRLVRAAVLSGRASDRVGEPVVNGTVIVQTADGRRTIARSETDDSGRFRIAGLPPERVVVVLLTASVLPVTQVLPNGVTISMPQQARTYFPGSLDAANAEVIALEPGEDHEDIDFVVDADQVGAGSIVFGGALRQNSTTAAGPLGTIRGRVTAAAGGALVGARIVLMGPTDPVARRAARTDAQGQFEIADVPVGTVRVAASKRGFEPARLSDAVLPAFPTQGAGRAVEVREGEAARVELELRRMGTVSGAIIDELGDPVQGVSVQLMHLSFDRGRRRLMPAGSSRLTDDRGRYRIYEVASGRYTVMATIGTIASADLPGYAPSYFPGGVDPRGAQFVTVAPSQDVTGIDVALTPARTARVSGKVLNAAGEPTTAGTFQLRPAGGADSFTGLSLPARIGDDGVFEFTNVAPGAYIIYADRGRRNGSTEGEFAAVPVAVAGEDVADLTVQMSAGSTIAGRVTFDARSPDNRPKVSDVELTAVPIDFDLAPGQPAHADIQSDWTFWFRGVSGTRRLQPTRLPPGWALRALLVNGADATDRPLVFARSGQSSADIEVVLTDRVSDIDGTVLDGDGHNVANAIILAMPTDRGLRYPMSRYLRRAASGDDGTFHLAAMPAGTYYVATVASIPIDGPDAWQDPAFLESLAPVVTTVTIGDGETRTITLRAR